MDQDNLDYHNNSEESENFILVLAKSPEWIKFCKIIEGHINARKTALGTGISSDEGVAIHNLNVGEINGMHFVINYPKLVEDKIKIKFQMEQLNSKMKEG